MIDDANLQGLKVQARHLSFDEQLSLIEHLVHELRATRSSGSLAPDSVLSEMAADPQIQQEMQAIEREFAGTEQDGLVPLQ